MNAPSLSGFLELTDAKFRLFDLGTQLRKLPESTLSEIDSGNNYPFPHLNYAWLVIFIWNPELKTQNSFWFLKLPLDEQGCVSSAVHSDLVNRLYKALQTQDEKERQRLITDHPFQFKPDEEKMAALHANVSKSIGLPVSNYYQSAYSYFMDDNSEIQWQDLGIQGIADLLVRMKTKEMVEFENKLRKMDEKLFIPIAQFMEHSVITASVTESLISRLDINNLALCNAILRGCSQSKAIKLLTPHINDLLIKHDGDMEFILILLTRYNHLLLNTPTAIKILDAVAKQTDTASFQKIVKSLTIQPNLSSLIATIFKSPDLTEHLANAIALMIQNQRIRYARK